VKIILKTQNVIKVIKIPVVVVIQKMEINVEETVKMVKMEDLD
jgi:hypothetical protein